MFDQALQGPDGLQASVAVDHGSPQELNGSYRSNGKLARAVATTTLERPPPALQEAEKAAPAPLPKQQSIGALMKRYSGTSCPMPT